MLVTKPRAILLSRICLLPIQLTAPSKYHSKRGQSTIYTLPSRKYFKVRNIFTIARLTMCKTETYKSHTCNHKWMTIVKPCETGASFNNQCHNWKPARSGLKKITQPSYLSAPANSCPNCDKKGEYDAGLTRMILEKPSQMGNMLNGYNMPGGGVTVTQPTDGYGAGIMVPGASYTTCGITRTSAPYPPYPSHQQGGSCVLM